LSESDITYTEIHISQCDKVIMLIGSVRPVSVLQDHLHMVLKDIVLLSFAFDRPCRSSFFLFRNVSARLNKFLWVQQL